MPSRNSIKAYVENGYYHIYNRGVEKRKIFEDEQDYAVFLSYFKAYLLPKNIEQLQSQLSNPNISWKERDKITRLMRLNNFYNEIKLLCFSLMPNHFHLLVRQKSINGIDMFIRSLNTRYVMYFNKKYKRVGPLYQGVYKAVLVETDEQLVHLSGYIHRNSLGLRKTNLQGETLRVLTRQPSSLPEYLKIRNSEWVSTTEILSFFSRKSKNLSYEKFVIGYDSPDPIIQSLTLDS